MNVKFLNTLYIPSREELRKLSEMQDLIHYTRAQYYMEIRHLPATVQRARVEELRRMYRARWEVIVNEDYEETRAKAE
jgi:hypothetical protein